MITQRQIRIKLKNEQRMVDAFNAKYVVGDKVEVIDDLDLTFVDTVKYPASIIGGHTAMAWLENKGSYLIHRVIGKKLDTYQSGSTS